VWIDGEELSQVKTPINFFGMGMIWERSRILLQRRGKEMLLLGHSEEEEIKENSHSQIDLLDLF